MCQFEAGRNEDIATRAGERRIAMRHAHGERVGITSDWGAEAGMLLDLSTSGAKVRLPNGLVPPAGEEVMLRLVDGRHIAGSIAWTDRDALGIRFEHELGAIEDMIWPEQRGADWYCASVRAQRQ